MCCVESMCGVVCVVWLTACCMRSFVYALCVARVRFQASVFQLWALKTQSIAVQLRRPLHGKWCGQKRK